jgi:heat shock protein HslJ/membrane-bound inhibitor of C-type lysozyme
MKKDILAIVVLVIAVIGLGALIGLSGASNITGPNLTDPTTATFAGGNQQQLVAIFGDGEVNFTYGDWGAMSLPQTISASGARYANADESIVLWNKGNGVTLYKDGQIVFQGTADEGDADTDVVGTMPPSSKLPAGSGVPGTQEQLAANSWVWTGSTLKDGTKVVPKKADAFTISFTADGKISGKTDCNAFSSSYLFGSDGVIVFSAIASTKMYCEGAQEGVYTSELGMVSAYQVSVDGLTLKLQDGGTMSFRQG